MKRRNEKQDLRDRLASLREELLEALNGQLDQCRVSSTHHPTEILDIAADGEVDDMAARLAEADAVKIEEIEEALERLKEGTYGICRECGRPIPKKRLKVLPFTTLCVNCKEHEEGNQGAGMGLRTPPRGAVEFTGLEEESDEEVSPDEDLYRKVSKREMIE